jgi:MoxR-like ATPase
MDRAPFVASHDPFACYRPHAELWALRVVLRFFDWTDHGTMAVAGALSRILDPGDCSIWVEPSERVALWKRAAQRLHALEAASLPGEGSLFRNVRMLSERLALSAPQEQVLLLCVMARLHAPLRDILESVGECDDARLGEVLAVALARPAEEILAAIDRRSALLSCGLLCLHAAPANPIRRLSPLPALSAILTRTYTDFDELFSAFARQAPAPSLAREDFAHLEGTLDLLACYLGGASKTKSRGRNVLLYGVPGTGKTEIARLAARLAKLRLYEAEVERDQGEPLDVEGRLRAVAFLQHMLARLPATAVLVDEAEDIFRPQDGPEPDKRGMAAADSKGWTVRFLESNPVPTIWISNRIRQIDEAVLRRFDLAIEIPVPPLAVRRRILQRSLRAPLAIGPEVERIVRDLAPAPALLSRASEVLGLAGLDEDASAARTLERIVRGYLAALGRDVGPGAQAEMLPFDPRCACVTPGVEEMLSIVRGEGRARVLLYGPSGTGKTACARHLAERLGAPLHILSAGDLISEPEITCSILRQAFSDARRDGAILFLDQLDWLVCTPGDQRPFFHQKALDVLCACLDSHSGPVFCATARGTCLDAGIVRRFPARMRFDCLKTSQVAALLGTLLGDDGAATALAQALAPLRTLTPGDIVAAFAHARALAARDLDRIRAMLAEGERLKSGAAASAIGFIAS